MISGFYQETQSACAPLVVTHAMPAAQSVAIGVFINVGSRDELASQGGITHALEHMLFKGTKNMTVHQLAEKLDELGGNANAYTSRERTCFHLHVLHEKWREALDILACMIQEPALPADEWVREREVIYAEMAMVDDNPDEWVSEQHASALFPDHVLGSPVLGSHDSLSTFSASDLDAYLQQWYCAPRMMIAAAGNIDHAALVKAVESYDWRGANKAPLREKSPVMSTGVQPLKRAGEQAQVIVSAKGINAASDERPVAWLANQLLGGGMSSRLFCEIREKRGLAYSVGSHLNSLSDTGMWSVSCSVEYGHAAECVSLLSSLLAEFPDSLTAEELDRARKQLEVQFRMGLDSVEGQMLYLGSRLDEDVITSPIEWLERIHKVGIDEVSEWTFSRLSGGMLWSIAAPGKAVAKICDNIAP